MSLANLLNVPSDPAGWSYFSFSNQDQHRQIAAGLLAKGTRVQDYQLDPIPLQDMGAWARTHQQSHNEFTQILGITGADLSSVDFTKPEQVASWIRLHWSEHQQAATMLLNFTGSQK